MYNAGWSFGKEKMGDVPDFSKGSFYFNPLTDNPSPELRDQFPAAVPANIWPSETDIPSFRDNCRELGSAMRNAVILLAAHIDRVLSRYVPSYQAGLFLDAMSLSTKAKARLLYYFPLGDEAQQSAQSDNWIAWHNDSGFLTCLASEIFVEHSTGRIISNPEPQNAGLFIAYR